VFSWLTIILFSHENVAAVSGVFSLIKAVCESERIAWCGETDAKGGEISWALAYERRMRRFNLEVVLVALSALAIVTA